MKLVFATHNSNKAKEIQSLMPKGIEVLTLEDIGCNEEIPETATTLEGNARLKTSHVVNNYNINCFSDDTGLEVEVLNNEPGVYSARYAGEHKDPNDNMNLLLSKLTGKSTRNARFRTVISLYWEGKTYEFEGIVNGYIATEKKGKDGFGYDPIFIPEGSDLTFAEIPLEKKNLVSHRAKAFTKMIEFLDKNK